MELYEANRILRAVKSALMAEGYKLPPSAETDGLMLLLDRLDAEKFLAPKVRHARTFEKGSVTYKRNFYYFAFFRALAAVKKGLTDPVTYTSVMLLHKTVCGDLDGDAGRPRGVNAATDGNAHTDPKLIPGSLKSIVAKMNEIKSSPLVSKEDFAGYLSHYMRELIIMHPFEQGSTFTVRLFFIMFCRLKGFSLLLYRATPSAVHDSEINSFKTDDITPLFKLFVNCLSYERVVDKKTESAPRTRREIARDLRRPPQPHKDEEVAAVPDGKKKAAAQSAKNREEVLRRAVRLQQKISKLNEQLTELIQPLENDKADDE